MFGKPNAPGAGAKGGGFHARSRRGASGFYVSDRVFARETRALVGGQFRSGDVRSLSFLCGKHGMAFFFGLEFDFEGSILRAGPRAASSRLRTREK